MKQPMYPEVTVHIAPGLTARRIRKLCEEALTKAGTSKSDLVQFKLDCLDEGVLVAAQRWLTVKVLS